MKLSKSQFLQLLYDMLPEDFALEELSLQYKVGDVFTASEQCSHALELLPQEDGALTPLLICDFAHRSIRVNVNQGTRFPF